MTAMFTLRNALRRFAVEERATATLELVIVFPLLMIVFIAAFESAAILTRQIILERSLDMTVRVLRLSRGVITNADEMRQTMCANTSLLPNCSELLDVDLIVVDENYTMPDDNQICASRGNDTIVRPANEFDENTGNNDFILVRTCLIVDPILPFSAFGLSLARDDSGGIHMIASTIFVNEPEA